MPYRCFPVKKLHHLFDSNRVWSERIRRQDPEFFSKLARQQSPQYLWIGCSDSRVPANEIVDLLPGELFVHRNLANVVTHTDLNCLSVIQFAVDVLKVRHIIVVGHYGCSGVGAALRGDRLCELNVVEQVANVCQTTMVQDAWERGQDLTVHGWVYGLRDGLVRDLEFSATSADEASASYVTALASLD